MGRNNQQRRAAKARARAKQQAGMRGRSPAGSTFSVDGPRFAGQGPLPGRPSAREQLNGWLLRAFDALDRSDFVDADVDCADMLALAGDPAGRRLITTTLTEVITAEVDRAWQRGWQPADLHRIVGRRLDEDAQAVVADAVAAQLRRFAPGTLAPRWPGQLREMGATVWWSSDTDPVSARSLTDGRGLGAVAPVVVRVAHLLATLPRVERHDPLPGTARPQPRREQAAVDERILARVRALLAKAESTTFEAEAETFTAGAQALMARHSIDMAMLAGDRTAGGGPQGRRIGIDRPYESPKVLLLDVVANANRCRSIWSKELGFVTVVGFESDLEACETIFTSLLVQANHAMQAHGRRTTRFGQSRTRAFRQSFLMSYAHRIGERLREVTEEETEAAVGRAGRAGAGSGQELVHVLGVRASAVDDAMAALFPQMVQRSVGSSSDVEGWAAGRRAADEATFVGLGRMVRGERAEAG